MANQSLKREYSVGDSEYDADTEGKISYMTRRKVHRNSTSTPQTLKKSHYLGPATPSPRDQHPNPLFSNPVQDYDTTNNQGDIHGELRGSDGSFNTETDNSATLDWTSDYEDEEIIASVIMQQRNENGHGEIQPFLPENVIVNIFETMIYSTRNLQNSNTTPNSEPNLSTSTEGEDTNAEPSKNHEMGTNGRAGEGNVGMIDAICFALTCLSNKIFDEFNLSMAQQLILAPLLETWIGPDYRRPNIPTFHSYAAKDISSDGSQGYINMFLSRKVYGMGNLKKNSRKELSLWRRYKAQSQILDCSGQFLEDFMLSTDSSEWKAALPRVQLLSPFGMGTTWYSAAAQQYRDIFTSWKSEYSVLVLWNYKAPVDLNHPSVTQPVVENAQDPSVTQPEAENAQDPSVIQSAVENAQVVRDIIQLERDVLQDLAIDHVFRGDVWALFPQDEFPADEYGEQEMRAMFRAVTMGDD